jgi:hypothetical protein
MVGRKLGAKDFTGLLALGGYGVGLIVGGLVGAIAGIVIVFLFHRRSIQKRKINNC